MILYSVTVNIDKDIEKEWLDWMKSIHIPDVLKTGMFVECKMYRILGEVDDGITYSFQYFANSIADIDKYLQEHAPRLMQDHNERYKNKYVSHRTVLESVDL